MLKNAKLCATFALLMLLGTPLTGTAREAVQAVPLAEINYALVFGDPATESVVRGPAPAFINSVITWLAANFALPDVRELPQIEFASPLKLVAMRYKGMLPDAWREDSIRDPSVQAAHNREIVAVYNDKTKTIYLPENWTGVTPTEQSVLVHELVHHLQNVGKLQYECPAAREKLAYEAQGDWLKLRGMDIESEFGLDLFTIFVSSACMN